MSTPEINGIVDYFTVDTELSSSKTGIPSTVENVNLDRGRLKIVNEFLVKETPTS